MRISDARSLTKLSYSAAAAAPVPAVVLKLRTSQGQIGAARLQTICT